MWDIHNCILCVCLWTEKKYALNKVQNVLVLKLNRSGYCTVCRSFIFDIEWNWICFAGWNVNVNELEMSWSPCSGKLFLICMYIYLYLYSFTVHVVIIHCLKNPTHALYFKIHTKTQSLFKTLECLRLLFHPTCFGHILDHLQGMFLGGK